MLTLILGGSASGKSAFAEQYAQKESGGGPLIYAATLPKEGPGNEAIIARHRKLRENKGFLTIEAERNLGALGKMHDFSKATILLECVSNLLANEWFCREHCTAGREEIVRLTEEEILALASGCRNLIAVSSLIFEDGMRYDPGTAAYAEGLGEINRFLLSHADRAAEIVYTVPNVLKGSFC